MYGGRTTFHKISFVLENHFKDNIILYSLSNGAALLSEDFMCWTRLCLCTCMWSKDRDRQTKCLLIISQCWDTCEHPNP